MQAREVRKLDPAHVREVANSISALGFCVPIVVGKDDLVLDGAARVQAARLLGLDRAPCVRIEHLSENEQRVLRLAVNRLGETGEWSRSSERGRAACLRLAVDRLAERRRWNLDALKIELRS